MDASAILPDPLFVDEPDLHEQDPSQKDGYSVVYDKECPFEMRMQEHDESPQEVGTLEAIRCRVCVQGDVSSPAAVVSYFFGGGGDGNGGFKLIMTQFCCAASL